jgi:hypothetical protein
MTAPDLSQLSTGELFARLAGQAVELTETPAPAVPEDDPEDLVDAWARRLAGKLIRQEADDSGWPLSAEDRRRAEELEASGTAYLIEKGALEPGGRP